MRRDGVGGPRRVVLIAAALSVLLPGGALLLPGAARSAGATTRAAGPADTPPSGPVWNSGLLSVASLASSDVTLASVSCADTADCVAVGSYTQTSSGSTTAYPQALVETYSDGTWTAYAPPVPDLPAGYPTNPGVTKEPPYASVLTGVSCVAPTACVAIGDETFTPTNKVSFQQYGFSETLSGTTWTPTFLPDQPSGNANPQGLEPTGNVITMGGISCVDASDCVAVGSYAVDESDEGGLAYTLTAGTWGDPALDVDPALEFSVTLDGVSCVATTDACVAVGGFKKETTPGVYVQEPLAEDLASGTWTATLQDNPPAGGGASLAGVSCSSAQSCEAVGTYVNGNGDDEALAEALVGTTWTPKTSLETGVASSELASIACDASGGCTAAGSYVVDSTDAAPATHLLVQTLSGSGFTPTLLSDPAGSSDPTFTSVSCPVQGSCIGVGNAAIGGGAVGPFFSTEQSEVVQRLVVTLPPTATVGHAVAGTVTAVDSSGALVPFDGAVDLTSSDPSEGLPGQITLVNGGGAFGVTFLEPGVATVTASVSGDSSVAGVAVVTVANAAPAATVPTPPIGLSAQGTAGGVTLTWFPPTSNGGSPLTAYLVLRSTAAGAEQPLAFTGTTHYTDSSPVGGVKYYYVVEAVNRIGRSAPSNEVSSYATGNLAGGLRFTSTPDGKGYWLASTSGGVFSYGSAGFYGSLGNVHLDQPIVSMVATPDGLGYWLVAADGGVFSFGDARFYGSLGAIHLHQPIVGMASTRNGAGYWLVAADGGIFSFGDAGFYGSLGAIHLDQPIVGMAAAPAGDGYWMVASDGGIFNFGGSRFEGSLGAIHLSEPIIGMASTPDGAGYWLVASDGGVFCFGDAHFYGSLGNQVIPEPILGLIAGVGGNGYEIVNEVGVAVQFGG